MTHPIATAFLVLWLLFLLVNARSCYRTHVKKQFTSSIPLVGGLFGMVGFLLTPELKWWCWLAVLMDYGSVVLLLALPKVAGELWQTSSINLINEFIGEDGSREVRIKLYKSGVFVIKHRIGRPKDEPGLIASSDIGTWWDSGGAISLTLRGDSVLLSQDGERWRVDRSFSHYGGNRDLEVRHIPFRINR